MRVLSWTRFWRPVDQPLHVDDDGFLPDPEGRYGKLLYSAARSLEEMESTHCLVLLGEPGIGKSVAIEQERQRLTRNGPSGTDTLRVIDLKDYGDESRLLRDAFDSEAWAAGRGCEGKHILFLDSLDEGLLRVGHLTRLILQGLRGVPRGQVRVRIACRTADWPQSLEQGLVEVFGRTQVDARLLLPLRARDVREAARDAGVDPDAFLAQVATRRVGPFAATPVTLQFLLGVFQQKAELPKSRAALYEQGCLNLCREPDQERREEQARHPAGPHLAPEACLAIASRIAAATLFANRAAITVEDEAESVRPNDVTVSELVGDEERGIPPIRVEGDAIRTTLRSGLFGLRDRGRLSFAHRSYAEFLAARYAAKAPIEQVKSLLSDSGATGPGLVPQLWEVAAWLAGVREDIFSWIVSTEPEVLLRSDTATVHPELLSRVVAALLARVDADELPETWELRNAYPRLAHAGLADQLEPFLGGKTLKVGPRRAAIYMAEACRVVALQSRLADVALDPEEPIAIRMQAARAVWRIGDDTTKEHLLPLAQGNAGPDPEDELRGIGLYCVWPNLLRTPDLLRCILPPRCPSNVGRYSHFLTEEVAGKIPPDEVSGALRHAVIWLSGTTYPDPLLDLTVQLIERGLALWDHPGVMPGLAALLAVCVQSRVFFRSERGSPIQPQLLANETRRRALLEELLNRTSLAERDCTPFLMAPLRLIADTDSLWLLEQLEAAPTDRRPVWAWVIARAVGIPSMPAVADRLLTIIAREPALVRAYDWLNAWDLESPRARKAKAEHLRRLRMERRRPPTILTPSPEERVAQDLELIEERDPTCWVQLTFDLTLEPTSSHYNLDTAVPIDERPGWKSATTHTRERIRAAARAYLSACPPGTAWLGGHETPWPVIAGFLALQLLEEEVLERRLPQRTLETWTPVLIATLPTVQGAQERLMHFAYGEVPDAVLRAAELLLDREDALTGQLSCLHRFDSFWDARIGAMLLGRLKRGELQPGSVFALGDLLLSRQVEDAEAYCAGQIPATAEMNAYDRRVIVQCLALLLIHAPKSQWKKIWPYFTEQADLAEEALARALEPRTGPEEVFLVAMDEEQLGDLYFWLSKRFPAATDPDIKGMHSVTPRERFADLRSSVLQHLVHRGTPAACDGVARLVDALPEQHPWLRWQLREVREKARSRAWRPPTPSGVIALFQDSQRRYVTSEGQLLSAVSDSLGRLQGRFKERPSALESLWNYDGGGTRRRNFRPKDEESLSDYIADWLKDDLGPSRGVVVNREVQPRRGQKTDLYVNAVVPGSDAKPADCLTVVVEVKGCWNTELWTAMRNQLVDSYMSTNALGYGIYLVGWYLCNAWSDTDGRKGATPRDPLDDIRTRLLSQAKEIAGTPPKTTVIAQVLDLRLD